MTVTDNPAKNRFELLDDERVVGWVDYRPARQSVIVLHTEIADGNERRGLGSLLVRGMLDQVEAGGKTVIPMCPFTAAYIRRHPEYARVVDSSLRDQFS
jgi:predicted GNAT family acetyltransferase